LHEKIYYFSIKFINTEESARILRERLEKKIAMRFEDCEWQFEEREEQAKVFFKKVPENLNALFAYAG
jgi:hypothetical protein